MTDLKNYLIDRVGVSSAIAAMIAEQLEDDGYRVVKLDPDGQDIGPSLIFADEFILEEL